MKSVIQSLRLMQKNTSPQQTTLMRTSTQLMEPIVLTHTQLSHVPVQEPTQGTIQEPAQALAYGLSADEKPQDEATLGTEHVDPVILQLMYEKEAILRDIQQKNEQLEKLGKRISLGQPESTQEAEKPIASKPSADQSKKSRSSANTLGQVVLKQYKPSYGNLFKNMAKKKVRALLKNINPADSTALNATMRCLSILNGEYTHKERQRVVNYFLHFKPITQPSKRHAVSKKRKRTLSEQASKQHVTETREATCDDQDNYPKSPNIYGLDQHSDYEESSSNEPSSC